MARLELPPTRSSLRKLKQDLAFAYEGYDLLNQKREILALEIVRKIDAIKSIETRLEDVLQRLYESYREAAVDMGAEELTLQSCSQTRGYFLDFGFTKLMGLKLPDIRVSLKKSNASIRLPWTTASCDKAAEQSQKALFILVEYATGMKSIIILSRELKKMQRRVNALDKIFIPQHEEAKKYIAERIDEMEREEIFVKKLIRQRQTES
ncbi:MAG: V-type ATP synthase subunit D [Syntrophobacteraceae bacterium]